MTNLEKAFKKMKADVQVKQGPRPDRKVQFRGKVRSRPADQSGYTVDVKDGKFIFDLGGSGAKVTIQDADTDSKHILVNVQHTVTKQTTNRKGNVVISNDLFNDKWLCGHDERDWFVAAVKGTSITEAKQNLKPKEVVAKEVGVKRKKTLNKRKNEAFLRQGEWFFVPAKPGEVPDNPIIHNDEPMSRPGGGKPHIVEEVYRTGGKDVWASMGSRIITDGEYDKLDEKEKSRFTRRKADANVYCRGYVKHPDHKTIILKDWHRIYMNTEVRNSGLNAGARLVFLD
jgi:hypothetical protein